MSTRQQVNQTQPSPVSQQQHQQSSYLSERFANAAVAFQNHHMQATLLSQNASRDLRTMHDYRDTTTLRKPSLMHGYHNPFSNSDRGSDHYHQHMSTNRYNITQPYPMQTALNDDYLKKPPRQQLTMISGMPQCQSSALAQHQQQTDMTHYNDNNSDAIDNTSKKDQNQQMPASLSSSSSSYVPQVEAISPTPEDQKENSNLQEIKEKICSEISKVDRDIANTQYQVDVLKKRQIELEKPPRSETISTLVEPIKTKITLVEQIYKDNSRKAEESHRELDKLNGPSDGLIPLYHEYSDTKSSKEIRLFYDQVMKKRLLVYFRKQYNMRKQREKHLCDKYDELYYVWHKRVDSYENSANKKRKDFKCREYFEKFFPELRKQREEKERLTVKQLNRNLSKNEDDSEGNSVETETDPVEDERKRLTQFAVIPPLCKPQKYKFVNNNGFIKDPLALFKSKRDEVFWSDKEKEIFLEKLLNFGKNFELIATFLEKKKVQDCIEYYYLTKKKVNYKLLMRKQQRKRKKDAKINNNNNNNSNNNNGSSGAGGGGGGGGSGCTGTYNSNSTNQSTNSNMYPNSGLNNSVGLSSSVGTRALSTNTVANMARTYNQHLELLTTALGGNSTNANEQNANTNQTNQNANLNSNTSSAGSGADNNQQQQEMFDNSSETFGADTGGGDGGDDGDRDDNNGTNVDAGQANRMKTKHRCSMCKRTRNKSTRKLPQNKSDLLTDSIRIILKNEFNLLSANQQQNPLDQQEPREFNLSKERFCNTCFNKINKKIDELLNHEEAYMMSGDEGQLVIDDDNNDDDVDATDKDDRECTSTKMYIKLDTIIENTIKESYKNESDFAIEQDTNNNLLNKIKDVNTLLTDSIQNELATATTVTTMPTGGTASFAGGSITKGTSLSTNSYASAVSCSKTSADTAASQMPIFNILVASNEPGKLRLADVIDDHVQKALDTNTSSSQQHEQQHQQANFSNFNLLSSLLSNAGTATSSSSSSSTSSATCPMQTIQKMQEQQQTLKDFKTMQNEYLNNSQVSSSCNPEIIKVDVVPENDAKSDGRSESMSSSDSSFQSDMVAKAMTKPPSKTTTTDNLKCKQITLETLINNIIEDESDLTLLNARHSKDSSAMAVSQKQSRINALLNKPPTHQQTSPKSTSAGFESKADRNGSSMAKKIKLEENSFQYHESHSQAADEIHSPPPLRPRSCSITKKILEDMSIDDQFKRQQQQHHQYQHQPNNTTKLNEPKMPQSTSPVVRSKTKVKENHQNILILNRTPSPSMSSPSHSVHEAHSSHHHVGESGGPALTPRHRKNSMTMKLLCNDQNEHQQQLSSKFDIPNELLSRYQQNQRDAMQLTYGDIVNTLIENTLGDKTELLTSPNASERDSVDVDPLSSGATHKEHYSAHGTSSTHRRSHHHANQHQSQSSQRMQRAPESTIVDDDGSIPPFTYSDTKRLIQEGRSYGIQQPTSAKSKQQQQQQQQQYIMQQQQKQHQHKQTRMHQTSQQASSPFINTYNTGLEAYTMQQNILNLMSRYPNNLQLTALLKIQQELEQQQQRTVYAQAPNTMQLAQQQFIDAQYKNASNQLAYALSANAVNSGVMASSPYAPQRGVYMQPFYQNPSPLNDPVLLQHMLSPNSLQEILKNSASQKPSGSQASHPSQSLLMPSQLNMPIQNAMNSDSSMIRASSLRSPQHTSILTGTVSNNPPMNSPMHQSKLNALIQQQQQQQQHKQQHSLKKRILSQIDPPQTSSIRSKLNKPTTYHVDYELLSDTDDS